MRSLVVPTLGLATIAAGFMMQPKWLLSPIARHYHDVLFFADTRRRALALTFDDGPHDLVTPCILDVLAHYEARATFFVLGERVVRHPKVVERIVSEGHELGNHMMIDAPSIRLPASEFQRQLEESHHILRQYGPVYWFRPGSGWFNRRMLRQIKRLGYRCVLGSTLPYDAHLPLPNLIARYLQLRAFPGAILALHDGTWSRRRTVDILKKALPVLYARGYTCISLSQLMAD